MSLSNGRYGKRERVGCFLEKNNWNLEVHSNWFTAREEIKGKPNDYGND